jgi:hypothetical protein
MLGYLLIGVLLGMISAGISLLLGGSVLWALAIYVIAGISGVVLSAAIVHVWSRLFKDDTVDTWSSDTNCNFRLPSFF